ncbi:hypothetical protein GALMADRAFT_449582 [Galerina marginata CBS 339.88]|uniref:Uncharacterized protein n=1 Tax=Galerina marginata (strain CBS 339.88) TaxID=685588 RepID=A0A067T082_GALM3|nr:hypothetical protein GALMADRAFT_449582 [Galerina marginata CBS 339.88]
MILQEYFTMLQAGLRRKKKTIINIFTESDAMIFPETASSLAGTEPRKESLTSLTSSCWWIQLRTTPTKSATMLGGTLDHQQAVRFDTTVVALYLLE